MNAEEYERLFKYEGDYWWYVGRRRLVLSLVKAWLLERQNPVILDIGCGTGAMSVDLQSYGEVVDCDFAQKALEYCRERSLNNLVRGDIVELPFRDSTFDLVVALDILEHINDDMQAMREIRRVLKPSGNLVATVPAYQFLWSNHDIALNHCRRYVAGAFKKKLMQAGFSVKKMSYAVSILCPAIIGMRLLSKVFDKHKEPSASIVTVPHKVNSFLEGLQELECNIIRRVNLPFGITIIAVCEP